MQWLQILLARQDAQAVRVRVGATPGMHIAEMLLRTIGASEQNPRQSDVVVADLALAEFREVGVRDEISALATKPEVNSALRSLTSANPDLADAGKMLRPLLESREQPAANSSADESLASRLEDSLQRGAEKWSFVAQRERLVAIGLLRYAQWQHRLLHITSDTRIPTHSEPYRTNLQLLELLMRFAKARDIHPIFFFGPVRDLEPNPDDPHDLTRMRQDITGLCRQYAVSCFDYSREVPEGYWADYSANQRGAFAMMAGQHDFYHFKEEGHRALAERIISDSGSKFMEWSRAGKPQ
jgi:hypothetical protein